MTHRLPLCLVPRSPGYGNPKYVESGNVGLVNSTLMQDQGIYRCMPGTTTSKTDTTQNDASGDCDQLLPGWMLCPPTKTVAAGFVSYDCPALPSGVSEIFTLAGSYGSIIPCLAGGYCPGQVVADIALVTDVRGFTQCDGAAKPDGGTLEPGFWSKANSTSVANCNLLSAKYYWTGSAPALCPWTDFCPGGLSTTGKTVPFGNYKCAAGKTCLATATTTLDKTSACSCDVGSAVSTFCKPCV